MKKSKRVGRERFAAANGDSPEFAINVETGKAGNTMSNLPQFVIVLRVHWACEVLTFWLVLALVAVAPANHSGGVASAVVLNWPEPTTATAA